MTVFPHYEDSLSLLTDVLCRRFYVQKWSHTSRVSDRRITKNFDHRNVFNKRKYFFIYISVGCFDNSRSTTRTHSAWSNNLEIWVPSSKWWTAYLVVFIKNNKNFMYSPWLLNWSEWSNWVQIYWRFWWGKTPL